MGVNTTLFLAYAQEDNCSDFLFTFLNFEVLQQMGSALERKNFLLRKQSIFAPWGANFYLSELHIEKGGKMKMAELFPLFCTHSP